MLNQVMLVGRMGRVLKRKDNTIMELSIARDTKNEEGIYETDIIDCMINNQYKDAIQEYCKQGDIVGIKGKLRTNNNKTGVLVEKLTFLSTKPKEDE